MNLETADDLYFHLHLRIRVQASHNDNRVEAGAAVMRRGVS